MDTEQRRGAVIEALRIGIVPREEPLKMWAGFGTNARCALCGRRLQASDIEYELEFASGISLIVDSHCHSLWDEERTKA